MKDKFEIKESPNFGKGLFATMKINKNEHILECIGPVISLEEALRKPQNLLGNTLQIGPFEYIDFQEPGVLVNHSCLPNAGIKNDRFLIAIKDILPGQEIFFDYSTTMDEDRWTMQCGCGEESCRRVIKDFKYLPPELRQKYLDLNIVQNFIASKCQLN